MRPCSELSEEKLLSVFDYACLKWAAQIDKIETAHREYDAVFRNISDFMEKRNAYVKEVLDMNGPLMGK